MVGASEKSLCALVWRSITVLIILSPFQIGFPIILKWAEDFQQKYSHFPESLRQEMVNETKKMFYFGYDNYMNLAFPLDELNPILCKGRGPDYGNP